MATTIAGCVPAAIGPPLSPPRMMALDAGSVRAGTEITMSNLADAVALVESVTVTAMVKEPAAVGVPLRVPPEDTVKPAGKLAGVALQVRVPIPPAAVST